MTLKVSCFWLALKDSEISTKFLEIIWVIGSQYLTREVSCSGGSYSNNACNTVAQEVGVKCTSTCDSDYERITGETSVICLGNDVWSSFNYLECARGIYALLWL